MILDLNALLLQPLVVFSRIDRKDTGYTDGRDLFAVTEVMGTWRKIEGRAADASGVFAPTETYKVHVPDSGEFLNYADFTGDRTQGWTLSEGDYVALGADVTAEGVEFADGFVMPYEVTTDGFGIIGSSDTVIDGVPVGRICSPEQVIKQVRKHGGFAVKSWRDLRGNGGIRCGGVPGMFARCIYMEG